MGTADVQVLMVDPPSKLCTASSSIQPSTEKASEFELAIALAVLVESVVPRMVMKEEKFKTGYPVLLRRGNQPKGAKFEARM